MTIETIKLAGALPRVFAGTEREASIGRSQIWLSDVTFSRGHQYMVEAESGTGKSSMCSYIYGSRDDYSGHIYFNDTDIRTLSIAQWCALRRTQLALLPQDMRLFPELTALENVQIKNRLTRHLSEQKIIEMFERLEIAEKLNQRAALLSIGQQQRVAIIRALAQPFAFILLDEPVSHLDQRNNRIVAEMVVEHAHAMDASIITTSVGNPLLLGPEAIHLSL